MQMANSRRIYLLALLLSSVVAENEDLNSALDDVNPVNTDQVRSGNPADDETHEDSGLEVSKLRLPIAAHTLTNAQVDGKVEPNLAMEFLNKPSDYDYEPNKIGGNLATEKAPAGAYLRGGVYELNNIGSHYAMPSQPSAQAYSLLTQTAQLTRNQNYKSTGQTQSVLSQATAQAQAAAQAADQAQAAAQAASQAQSEVKTLTHIGYNPTGTSSSDLTQSAAQTAVQAQIAVQAAAEAQMAARLAAQAYAEVRVNISPGSGGPYAAMYAVAQAKAAANLATQSQAAIQAAARAQKAAQAALRALAVAKAMAQAQADAQALILVNGGHYNQYSSEGNSALTQPQLEPNAQAFAQRDVFSRVLPYNEYIYPERIPGFNLQCSKSGELHFVTGFGFDCLMCFCQMDLTTVCASCGSCNPPSSPGVVYPSKPPSPSLPPQTPHLPLHPTPMPSTLETEQQPLSPSPKPFPPNPYTPQELYPEVTCKPLPANKPFQNPLNPCQECICHEEIDEYGRSDVQINCHENLQCILPPEATTLPPFPESVPIPLPLCDKFPLEVEFPHPNNECEVCRCVLPLGYAPGQLKELVCHQNHACIPASSTIFPSAPSVPPEHTPQPGPAPSLPELSVCDLYPLDVTFPNPNKECQLCQCVQPSILQPKEVVCFSTSACEGLDVSISSTARPLSFSLVEEDQLISGDLEMPVNPLPGPSPHESCAPYMPNKPFEHPWDDCRICVCFEKVTVSNTFVEINCYTKKSCCDLFENPTASHQILPNYPPTKSVVGPGPVYPVYRPSSLKSDSESNGISVVSVGGPGPISGASNVPVVYFNRAESSKTVDGSSHVIGDSQYQSSLHSSYQSGNANKQLESQKANYHVTQPGRFQELRTKPEESSAIADSSIFANSQFFMKHQSGSADHQVLQQNNIKELSTQSDLGFVGEGGFVPGLVGHKSESSSNPQFFEEKYVTDETGLNAIKNTGNMQYWYTSQSGSATHPQTDQINGKAQQLSAGDHITSGDYSKISQVNYNTQKLSTGHDLNSGNYQHSVIYRPEYLSNQKFSSESPVKVTFGGHGQYSAQSVYSGLQSNKGTVDSKEYKSGLETSSAELITNMNVGNVDNQQIDVGDFQDIKTAIPSSGRNEAVMSSTSTEGSDGYSPSQSRYYNQQYKQDYIPAHVAVHGGQISNVNAQLTSKADEGGKYHFLDVPVTIQSGESSLNGEATGFSGYVPLSSSDTNTYSGSNIYGSSQDSNNLNAKLNIGKDLARASITFGGSSPSSQGVAKKNTEKYYGSDRSFSSGSQIINSQPSIYLGSVEDLRSLGSKILWSTPSKLLSNGRAEAISTQKFKTKSANPEEESVDDDTED